MCLAALPSALHGWVAPSTKLTASRRSVRSWRNRLSASVLHVADGLQSATVAGWRAPVTWPTYCARLLSCSSVSVHCANQLHCVPRPWRYGMAGTEARADVVPAAVLEQKTTTER